jgi:VanZ family protein/glutaredoxin
VLLYGAVVFYLSSLPRAPVTGRIPDYVLHPVEYLGLTLLLVRALNGGFRTPLKGSLCLGAVALAVAYAVSDEIHQLHVPRRTASVKDVLSDTLGAVLAVGVAEGLQRARGAGRARALRVTLYTRAGCALCGRAKEILDRVAQEIPMECSEVDVDSDPALASAYGDQVPVILADGDKISKLAPDKEAIRRRLLRRARTPSD